MARKTALVIGIIFSLALVSTVLAQDTTVQQAPATPEAQVPAPPAAPAETPAQAPAIQAEPEIQWLWGEAVSVDPQKNEVVVKYQDFDAEQEKEMSVLADDKTTFENVKSLAEIQPKDTVSIDYKVTADGKNIAKNVSVEKAETPEAVSGSGAPAAEAPAAAAAAATSAPATSAASSAQVSANPAQQ
jgi:hypothetical protein